MTHTILTGGDAVTTDEAEATVRHYTPGVQEGIEETPDEVDRTPITDSEREALDEASASTFKPLTQDQPTDRAETFQVRGEWESPVARHRRKQAMMLPSIRQIDDLDQRVAAVLRFDGAPKAVTRLGQKARAAMRAARDTYGAGQHPDNRRYALSQAAKDAVIQEIAKATTAVSALEAEAQRPEIQDEWFANLTAEIADLRSKAASDGEAFARSYAAWRQRIAAADALAKEQGRFGEWHKHPQERELNPLGLIGEIRKARDIANSDDDWVNGDYLTTEYDGIPPHTVSALERSAEVAGSGSYAEQVLMRVKSPHPADGPVVDAIASKDLRIIHTSPIPALLPQQQPD